MVAVIEAEFPGLPNARWVALRLLEGDDTLEAAVQEPHPGRPDARNLAQSVNEALIGAGVMTNSANVLETAARLRAEMGEDYHDKLMEAIYTDASQIADRSVSRDESRRA